MTKVYRGRAIVPGTAKAKAVVTHHDFNMVESFKKILLDKKGEAVCSDQDNKELYNKHLTGKILCLRKTAGSDIGGMVILTVCSAGVSPAAMLFSEPIDPIAASGTVLASVWSDMNMPAVDSLGDEFLEYVKNDMLITVSEDGTVTVES